MVNIFKFLIFSVFIESSFGLATTRLYQFNFLSMLEAPETNCSEQFRVPINHLQQCAIDLCGPPDESKLDTFLTDENFERLVNSQNLDRYSRLFPLVEEVVQNQSSLNEAIIDRFNQLLGENEDQVNIDSSIPPRELVSFLSNYIMPYIQTETFSTGEIKDRYTIETNFPNDWSQKKVNFFSSFIESKEDDVTEDLGTLILLDLISTEESITLYQQEILDYKMRLSAIKSQLQLQFEANGRSDLENHLEAINQQLIIVTNAQRTFNAQSISSSNDIRILRGELELHLIDYDISYAEVILSNPEADYQYSSYRESLSFCANNLCDRQIEEIINNLPIREAIIQLDRDNDPELIQAQMNRNCQSLFRINSLTRTEEVESDRIVVEVKSSIMNSYFSNFSDETREELQNYLNERVKFDYDLSRARTVEDIQQNINLVNDMMNIERERIPNLTIFELVYMFSPYNNDMYRSNVNNITSICDGGPNSERGVPLIWDAFLPQEGYHHDSIYVSHFSCNNPSMGKGIIAHEIGHAINYFFSNEENTSKESSINYKSQRICSNNMTHPDYQRPIQRSLANTTFFTGDHLRSEEDMADFISSLVSTEKSHPHCVKLRINSNESRYDNAEIDFMANNDNHSPPLIRALRRLYLRNEVISPSCQHVINQYSEQYGFHRCD